MIRNRAYQLNDLHTDSNPPWVSLYLSANYIDIKSTLTILKVESINAKTFAGAQRFKLISFMKLAQPFSFSHPYRENAPPVVYTHYACVEVMNEAERECLNIIISQIAAGVRRVKQ